MDGLDNWMLKLNEKHEKDDASKDIFHLDIMKQKIDDQSKEIASFKVRSPDTAGRIKLFEFWVGGGHIKDCMFKDFVGT